MNTPKDLAKRLLRLYPVKLVKEEFGVEGLRQNDLVDDIVNNNATATIQNFALNNFESTKQHVYIYSLNKKFNRKTFDKTGFPTKIEKEVNDGKGNYSFFCVPIVVFKTTLNNPFEEIDLKFIQPMVVSIADEHLIIRATIMEKNIGNYFSEDRKVIDLVKSTNIDYTDIVVSHFATNYKVESCDLNKGVKFLWDKDMIDSKYAKWKKDKSTTTESMDENYTLKKQYSDIYKNLIKAPLNKMIFKYLLGDEKFPDHFSIDPSAGQLSIPLFPGKNQVTNVINEILSNN